MPYINRRSVNESRASITSAQNGLPQVRGLINSKGMGELDWRTLGGNFDSELATILTYIDAGTVVPSGHPLYARTQRVASGQERINSNIIPWIEERIAKGIQFTSRVNSLLSASGINVAGSSNNTGSAWTFVDHAAAVVAAGSPYAISNEQLAQMGGYNAVFTPQQVTIAPGTTTVISTQGHEPNASGSNVPGIVNSGSTPEGFVAMAVERVQEALQGNMLYVVGAGVALWFMFGRGRR